MMRKNVYSNKMQMGFVPDKGTTDAIFSMRQMTEK